MEKERAGKKDLKKKASARKTLREISAGGVVFRRKQGETRWLIAKSSPSDLYPESYWRLPKGWLDDDQGNPGPLGRGERRASEIRLREAALREVAEEGGVEAKILKKVGTERIFFTKENGEKTLKFVTYYLMEWRSNLANGFGPETSRVSFLPFEEARNKLKYRSEQKVLEKAKQILDSGIQDNLI